MRNVALLAVVVVTILMLAPAQSQANFEGTWRMDKTRSQYPAEPATEVIHPHGDVIDISFSEKWPGRRDSPCRST